LRHVYFIKMDYKFLYQRVKNLIADPAKEWDSIMSGDRKISFINFNFLLPLVIMASVSAFLGTLIFTHSGLDPLYAVMAGIRTFILFYFIIYAFAFIFNEITNYLGAAKDFELSFRLIVYSLSPFLLCQIMSQLFESLIFVNILAFYGLYIFWAGLVRKPGLSEKQKWQLFLAAALLFLVLSFSGSWLLTRLSDKLYFALFA